MPAKILTYKSPIYDEGYKTSSLFKMTSQEPVKTWEKIKDIALEAAAKGDCPKKDKLKVFGLSPFHELHSSFSKTWGLISINKQDSVLQYLSTCDFMK